MTLQVIKYRYHEKPKAAERARRNKKQTDHAQFTTYGLLVNETKGGIDVILAHDPSRIRHLPPSEAPYIEVIDQPPVRRVVKHIRDHARQGEQLLIGEDIKVTICRISGGQVRLGVEAPDDVEIDREELREKKRAQGDRDAAR